MALVGQPVLKELNVVIKYEARIVQVKKLSYDKAHLSLCSAFCLSISPGFNLQVNFSKLSLKVSRICKIVMYSEV